MAAPAQPLAPSDQRVEAVRQFNRFYTRRIGVLDEGLLDSPFTLTESRLLWELAHVESATASELAATLRLDPGYLSRLLRRLRERRLVKGSRSDADGRQVHLALTAAGRRAFASLDAASRGEVGTMLAGLADEQQLELLRALAAVERLLGEAPARSAPYLLRGHRPGDIGWVVARHGALYAQEYQWDATFEALVARIAADFLERLDARRECCWIAERDGASVGCVFLVQARDDDTHEPVEGVAQLRMLLVEPSARGLGIGVRLVDECTRFARTAGYRAIRLWTNSVLTAARAIYQKVGYELVASEPHHSFGHDLVGETWELRL